jgi:hypothetical protein
MDAFFEQSTAPKDGADCQRNKEIMKGESRLTC